LRLGVHLPFGDWPRLTWSVAAAVTAGVLAVWESVSLVRAGRKNLAGPAMLGAVLAAGCAVAGVCMLPVAT